MRWLSIVLIAMLAWLSWMTTAYAAPADPAARARAEQAFERARAAESEMRYAEATKLYREAAEADPSAPSSPGSIVRARWLERRSEGSFAPLTTLERYRRDPAAASDAARVRDLLGASEKFPPGLVRAEARLAVGDAASRNLGDAALAIDAYRRVVEDESSPKGERVMAIRATIDLHVERGEWSAAKAAALRWGEHAPVVRDKTLKLYRRMVLTRVSFTLLVALASLGAYAFVRLASSRGRSGLRKAFPVLRLLAWPLLVGVGGATFAWFNEKHGMQPFLILGPGLIPLLILVRACRLAFPARLAQAGVALLGAAAVIALAWLSMTGSPGLMEGFGL